MILREKTEITQRKCVQKDQKAKRGLMGKEKGDLMETKKRMTKGVGGRLDE